MKINRRNFISASSAAVLGHKYVSSAFSKPTLSLPVAKEVTVYTTAANTDHRISKTGTATFKTFGQPKETQICVFVDPRRQFQTFLGIGGALTDAAAETFAKLPKPKQREFIDAHFDEERGIG